MEFAVFTSFERKPHASNKSEILDCLSFVFADFVMSRIAWSRPGSFLASIRAKWTRLVYFSTDRDISVLIRPDSGVNCSSDVISTRDLCGEVIRLTRSVVLKGIFVGLKTAKVSGLR